MTTGGAPAAGGAAGGAAAGGAAGLAAAAPLSMRATTVLMPTVLPSSTSTSDSVPAAGEGISVSTLSVEISNSGSSRSTCSPGFLSHLVSVPSTMLSPIWGITTSVMDQFSLSAARTGASYSISQSKTRPKCAAKVRETSSSVTRTPSCAMDVTGLVNPQGTMY
jgi:hypothetical protein